MYPPSLTCPPDQSKFSVFSSFNLQSPLIFFQFLSHAATISYLSLFSYGINNYSVHVPSLYLFLLKFVHKLSVGLPDMAHLETILNFYCSFPLSLNPFTCPSPHPIWRKWGWSEEGGEERYQKPHQHLGTDPRNINYHSSVCSILSTANDEKIENTSNNQRCYWYGRQRPKRFTNDITFKFSFSQLQLLGI